MEHRFVRFVAVSCAALAVAFSAQSAVLLVDSLADDVFPDHTGALFDVNGSPIVLASQKCTLRMATVASNIDAPVGGSFGCNAQGTSVFATGGGDNINFATAIAGGTILLNADRGMNTDGSGPTQVMLWFTGPVSLDGAAVPSTRITLDASATPTTNRRIMRFQEIAPAGSSKAGTSAWAQILSMNFRNSRMEGSGGCMFSNESVRLIDVEFANCESAVSGVAGALFVAASDNASTSYRPNVRLSRVTFKGNRSTNPGNTAQSGAFLLGTGGGGRVGHVSFSDVVVGGATLAEGNTATGFNAGGAIVNAESVAITNSRFENNVATNGNVGGLVITGTLSSAVTIADTTFSKNTSSGQVGGLLLANNGSSLILMRRVQVTNNQATSVGGMRIVGNSGTVDLSGVNVTGNTATSFVGGAVIESNSGPITRVIDSEFSQNTVSAGSVGGLAVQSQLNNTLLARVRIKNNSVSKGASNYAASGGASFSNNTNVALADSEISGNTSDFHIGAMAVSASFQPYDANGQPVTPLPPTANRFQMERTTISGNLTTATGGQGFATVYVTTPGVYTIVSSTVSGNTATGCGGGLHFDGFNPSSQTNSMQVQIFNSTIARNTGSCNEALSVSAFNPAAPSTPGAFNGSVTIESSVIAGRSFTATETVAEVNASATLSVVTSLLERGVFGTLSATCGNNGTICNVDAMLRPLADNGGGTRTVGLLPGSPAIDSGSNSYGSLIDQRLATRVQGAAIDMGAFESTPGGSCTLDMDGAGGVQANKEGLILVRSMLGFDDATAVGGTGISASQWTSVKNNLNTNCGTAGSFAP